MDSKAAILIRGIDEPMQYSFNYPLEDQIKKIIGQDTLTLDSLSDGMIIPYIEEFIGKKDRVYFILDLRLSQNPGIGRIILNRFIRNKNIELLCIGDTSLVDPFIKLYRGKSFNNESEMTAHLSSN